MAATAAWFGLMAYRAGKNCVVWSIGGGVLALVVSTVVMGLTQATFIPYCTDDIATLRIKVAVVAVLLVFCLGWLFTGTLHQHIRELLKQRNQPDWGGKTQASTATRFAAMNASISQVRLPVSSAPPRIRLQF